MKTSTLFNIYSNLTSREASLIARRPKGRFGIQVDTDPIALEYQRVWRLTSKLDTKIHSRLVKLEEGDRQNDSSYRRSC